MMLNVTLMESGQKSFNGKQSDELINAEVFDKLWEAKVLIEHWRKHFEPFGLLPCSYFSEGIRLGKCNCCFIL